MSDGTGKRGLRLVETRPAARTEDAPAIPAAARAYQRSVERYANRIRRAKEPAEIVNLLDQALRETRALHAASEATDTRRRTEEAERQIAQLRAELALVTGLLNEDPLTGLLNRRGLVQGFEREAARAARHRCELSLILLDLDNFKRLNDTHGHAAGDQVLMHLAGVAGAALRSSDLLARYGGEEFVIVMGESRLEEARQCALRLQAALAAAPLAWNGARIPITFSAGVVQQLVGESLDDCLTRADEALYLAKNSGRKRVQTAA
jgi:diguanylate cyclase